MQTQICPSFLFPEFPKMQVIRVFANTFAFWLDTRTFRLEILYFINTLYCFKTIVNGFFRESILKINFTPWVMLQKFNHTLVISRGILLNRFTCQINRPEANFTFFETISCHWLEIARKCDLFLFLLGYVFFVLNNTVKIFEFFTKNCLNCM